MPIRYTGEGLELSIFEINLKSITRMIMTNAPTIFQYFIEIIPSAQPTRSTPTSWLRFQYSIEIIIYRSTGSTGSWTLTHFQYSIEIIMLPVLKQYAVSRGRLSIFFWNHRLSRYSKGNPSRYVYFQYSFEIIIIPWGRLRPITRREIRFQYSIEIIFGLPHAVQIHQYYC